VIEIEGLCKQYVPTTGKVAAISDFSLSLGDGERFGLFGASGCGKTTLLRCLAGLERPDAGRIVISGINVFNATTGLNEPPWKRPIGLVFQDYALWPHMTVQDNVQFPLLHGRSAAGTFSEKMALAREALRAVRMEGFERRFPSELSGGQRQRVALARALAGTPRVLLLDEPLSSLDSHLRRQTRNELIGILQETGITTIFVSHDHLDGLFMANRLGVMRDGRLVQSGRLTEILAYPADATVAEVLNIGATIPCWRDGSGSGGSASYSFDGSGQKLILNGVNARIRDDGACSMLVRSDACRIWRDSTVGSSIQRLAGIAIQESFMGRGWCVLVRVAGSLLEVWEDDRPHVRPGATVEIAVDTARVQIVPRGH
jgi:iron(III) transport system ATP-binding protein